MLGSLVLLLTGLRVAFRILVELVLAFLTAKDVALALMRTGCRRFLFIHLHTANSVSLHWFALLSWEELSPRVGRPVASPVSRWTDRAMVRESSRMSTEKTTAFAASRWE